MNAVRMATISALVVSSLGFAPSAMAGSTIVDNTIELVRDRVCTDEHGYGVIDCGAEVDPIVDAVVEEARPYVGTAIDTVWFVQDEAEKVPGTVATTAKYVECWMLYPEDPDCQG